MHVFWRFLHKGEEIGCAVLVQLLTERDCPHQLSMEWKIFVLLQFFWHSYVITRILRCLWYTAL